MDILIVEDEKPILEVLQSYFLNEGWIVHTSTNGNDALEKVRTTRLDMVVLDLMLPGISGEEVCRSIRQFSNLPLIMLTSKANESDTINGLNLGADDYITKPFRMKEVVARIYALQRRMQLITTGSKSVQRFNRSRLIVYFDSKEVIVDGKPANLTLTEFKIMNILTKNPGKLYNRHDLSYEVQGYRYIGDDRTMDAHIKNIRRKIEVEPKNPVYISTKVGAGYKFNFFPDDE